MRRRQLLVILAIGGAVNATALAAERVPAAYRHIAAQYGIPADLFYAVAVTESGKSIRGGSDQRPWPWTLNIAGEGRFFATRVEAWRALDASLNAGEDQVDVGLMQINWRYHQTLLGNSWLALEPYRNLRLAAEILAACYRARADWWASVGCYHAPGDAQRARRYRNRVLAHWHVVQGSG